jgi:hypothetical protein
MNKFFLFLILFALIFSSIVLAGCVVSESREDTLWGTKKSQTEVGVGGVQTQTKECPFWNRNC